MRTPGSVVVAVAALAIVGTLAIAFLIFRSPAGQASESRSASPSPSSTSRPSASSAPTGTSSSAPSPGEDVVFVGAGDIAACESEGDEATAELLDQIVEEHPDAVVFTTGDNAYSDGSSRDFQECYDPSWGRHRDRTRPAVGNHDMHEPAEGYHEYFGDAGGPADRFYYSYDLNGWHIVVLNSECRTAGCTFDTDDGEQVEWLAADLEASDATCTIALWHHPRWSSGLYGNDSRFATFWELLYDHGAEIVLNGHEHIYERLDPMAADGALDDDRGIRQFTVATGGASLRDFGDIINASASRGTEFGVLKLTLGDGAYSWEFVAVPGGSFADSGTGSCH